MIFGKSSGATFRYEFVLTLHVDPKKNKVVLLDIY